MAVLYCFDLSLINICSWPETNNDGLKSKLIDAQSIKKSRQCSKVIKLVSSRYSLLFFRN